MFGDIWFLETEVRMMWAARAACKTILIVCFALLTGHANGEEVDKPRLNKPLRIGIMLLDDKVLGRYPWVGKERPKAAYLRFMWDGAHLTAHPLEDDKSEWPKESAAVEGWYVTADYSTMPPRVILTEKPTKYSKWDFEPGTRDGNYYLKNVGSPEKDAFLVLQDSGKRTPAGDPKGAVIKNAILSTTDKTDFTIADLEDENGK